LKFGGMVARQLPRTLCVIFAMRFWFILICLLALLMAPVSIAIAANNSAEPKPATPRHWSFIPPKHSAIPKVKNQAWVRNPIDAFVQARLEKERIKPSPAADPVTLIRRLCLDLIGLPPTPQEVEAFGNNQSADAYAQLVDRLLA